MAHGIEDPSLENVMSSVGAGPSCSTFIKMDPGNIPSEFVEAQLSCDNDTMTSHQSSTYSDPLSPNNIHDFTDDEPEESDDLSSDIDIN